MLLKVDVKVAVVKAVAGEMDLVYESILEGQST